MHDVCVFFVLIFGIMHLFNLLYIPTHLLHHPIVPPPRGLRLCVHMNIFRYYNLNLSNLIYL